VALMGWVLGFGLRRLLRAADLERGYLAGAFAGALTFALAAGADWAWEIAVTPVAFLLLAATLVAGSGIQTASIPPPSAPPRATVARRAVPAGAAILSVALLSLALIPARELGSAESALARSDPEAALEAARDAQDVQPYAATPYIQEALALQELGDLDAAIEPARTATEKEPTNWRTWHLVWQIETTRTPDDADQSAVESAYEKAFSLNPRSGSFESANPDGE
jgi:Flp pilus assembly protein TadD